MLKDKLKLDDIKDIQDKDKITFEFDENKSPTSIKDKTKQDDSTKTESILDGGDQSGRIGTTPPETILEVKSIEDIEKGDVIDKAEMVRQARMGKVDGLKKRYEHGLNEDLLIIGEPILMSTTTKLVMYTHFISMFKSNPKAMKTMFLKAGLPPEVVNTCADECKKYRNWITEQSAIKTIRGF